MTAHEPVWWGGTTHGATAQRATMIAAPLAERRGLHRWFPRLSGWIRLGAPISLLDAASVIRLLPLAVAFMLPAMSIAAGLPWLSAACGIAIAAVLLIVSLRPAFPWGQLLVLIGSHAVVLGAIASADDARRTGFALLPVAVAALFVGLFMRIRPAAFALGVGSLLLLIVTQATHDRQGFTGAVMIVVAAFLVGLMSTAMAHGARQAGSLDAETAIPNLRGVQRQLERTTEPTMVATVRLVGVASARDALGHEAGNELVRCVVDQLTVACPPPMRLGRGTDDELLIVLPVTGANDDSERAVLHAVRTAMGSGRFLLGSVEVAAEAHIGVSVWRPDADDRSPRLDEAGRSGAADAPSDVLRRSALAARQAATQGAEVRWWDGAHTTLSADDLELLTDLRDAGQRGELWIAYQPQFGPDGGGASSVEALMRWAHPARGNVSPERFITLAERTGLIDRLTDWMISEALDAQVRWRAAGLELAVSVNVSPLSLRRVDFAARVSEAIVVRGLPASVMTIEVTESSAFDVPEAVERLSPLRSLGVRIAIDDFGTGFTSLAILPDLSIDELKLDQRFVRNLLHDEANAAIVHSVLELAHRLGLVAVAEGAEDQATVSALRSLGYDLVQGYALSRPLSEEDLLSWLTPAAAPSPGSVHGAPVPLPATDTPPAPWATPPPSAVPSPSPAPSLSPAPPPPPPLSPPPPSPPMPSPTSPPTAVATDALAGVRGERELVALRERLGPLPTLHLDSIASTPASLPVQADQADRTVGSTPLVPPSI